MALVPARPQRPASRPRGNKPRETFVVTGTVLRRSQAAPAGAPAAGVTVQVFDQDVADATLLGKATTGADGKYRITFTASQFLAGDGGKAPAVQSPALQALIAASTTVVKSGPDLWAG